MNILTSHYFVSPHECPARLAVVDVLLLLYYCASTGPRFNIVLHIGNRLIDWCFSARQHKIGQFAPIYQGGLLAQAFEDSQRGT